MEGIIFFRIVAFAGADAVIVDVFICKKCFGILHEFTDGFFSGAGNAGCLQFPFVQMDDGLDLQHGCCLCQHLADASAFLQIAQVAGGKENAAGHLQFFQFFHGCFEGKAGLCHSCRFRNQKPFLYRCGKAVDDSDFAGGIFLHQPFCCQICALEGAAEFAGQVQINDFFAVFCVGQKGFIKIYLGGHRGFGVYIRAVCHFLIKGLRCDLCAVFSISFSVKGNIVWNQTDIVCFFLLCRNIAGTVAHNAKIHKISPPVIDRIECFCMLPSGHCRTS